jgi:MFS family permease
MSNSKSPESKLGSGYAWLVWILAVTFVVFKFSVQTGYAIINPSMQKDVGLTLRNVSIIAATYTWVYAVFQFYGGPLLDQLGSRKVIPASIALFTLGVFIFANAQSFEMLLISQFLMAIASCTGFVGAGYIGGKWFGMAKFSFMFGLVQVVASFTSAISQNLIDLGLKYMDWRMLFNFAGVFGIILSVLGAIFIRNPNPVASSTGMSFLDFINAVNKKLIEVAKIPHVWLSAIIGGGSFGVLLSLGVVWAPKLLKVRGATDSLAVFGSSMLWLGLTVGCMIVPWWSDYIQKRKMPIILGTIIQFIMFALLVYVPNLGIEMDLVLCFVFGFANSLHMLCFSTTADVVKPEQIGTSAAIVNGIMFIISGLMIEAPGARIVQGVAEGIPRGTMEMVRFAGLPLVLVLCVPLILSFTIRETFPAKS